MNLLSDMNQFVDGLMRAPRVAQQVTFGINPWENFGLQMASLGITVGGLVVCIFFYKLGEWITNANSSERWEYEKRAKKYKEITQKRAHNIVRLCCSTLGILTATFGFWVAAKVAGFNFWTVILGYGILSMVGTYAFGGPMRDAGAFLLIAFSDKVEEEWYVRIPSRNIEGKITSINVLWCDLLYQDEATGNVFEIQVPTSVILSEIVVRMFKKEGEMRGKTFRTLQPTHFESKVNKRV